ncbi:DUF6712 family protein [Prevotella sp. E13-17]|uniref:DUF6712 family protein n=1 Tax=Prevotella sp. E13-17 TaxID=2913616 RepID=UPI00351D4F1B
MNYFLEIIHSLQSYELQLLSDIQVNHQCYYDLVTIIREHPDVFLAWHSSSVADLYTPKTFQNKKIIRLLVLSGFFFYICIQNQ